MGWLYSSSKVKSLGTLQTIRWNASNCSTLLFENFYWSPVSSCIQAINQMLLSNQLFPTQTLLTVLQAVPNHSYPWACSPHLEFPLYSSLCPNFALQNSSHVLPIPWELLPTFLFLLQELQELKLYYCSILTPPPTGSTVRKHSWTCDLSAPTAALWGVAQCPACVVPVKE